MKELMDVNGWRTQGDEFIISSTKKESGFWDKRNTFLNYYFRYSDNLPSFSSNDGKNDLSARIEWIHLIFLNDGFFTR